VTNLLILFCCVQIEIFLWQMEQIIPINRLSLHNESQSGRISSLWKHFSFFWMQNWFDTIAVIYFHLCCWDCSRTTVTCKHAFQLWLFLFQNILSGSSSVRCSNQTQLCLEHGGQLSCVSSTQHAQHFPYAYDPGDLPCSNMNCGHKNIRSLDFFSSFYLEHVSFMLFLPL